MMTTLFPAADPGSLLGHALQALCGQLSGQLSLPAHSWPKTINRAGAPPIAEFCAEKVM